MIKMFGAGVTGNTRLIELEVDQDVFLFTLVLFVTKIFVGCLT